MDSISRRLVTTFVVLMSVILQGQSDLVVAQNTPFVLFGVRTTIETMSLDGSGRQTIHTATQVTSSSSPTGPDIRGIDYDIREGLIFWSELEEKVIKQLNMDGTNEQTLVSEGLQEPEDIAWDWVNKKLYWTDNKAKSIKVLDKDRGIIKTILHTGEESQPRAILVDPSNKYLYWTDWSDNTPRIVQTSMDGGGVSTVLANATWVTWPNGLTLDYTNQMLYWIDANTDTIGRINLRSTGSDRIQIIAQLQGEYHPWAMTYFDSKVYWTDWYDDFKVYRRSVSNRSGESIDTLVNALQMTPTGIAVVHESRQSLNVPNPCSSNNGGCSDLCLLSAVNQFGYICACPDGVELQQNGRYCGDIRITAAPPTPIPNICNTQQPCQNHGVCENLSVSTYICHCPDGFSGRNCEITQQRGGELGVSVTVFLGVVGGLIVILIVMMAVILLIVTSIKFRSSGKKERSQSLSALSTSSSRDSPTHVVVLKNGRIATEHDYASIKSRESPAPKGILISLHQNPYHNTRPASLHNPHTVTASSGTLVDTYLTPPTNQEKSITKSSADNSNNDTVYSTLFRNKTNTM